jgi:hypothetical protein
LQDLASKLRHLIEIEGRLSPEYVSEKINDDALVVGKKHLTSRIVAVDFIFDLGTSPKSFNKSISVTDARDVDLGIGRQSLSGIESILAICAGRSATNEANDTKLPLVLPRDLALVPPRQFNETVLEQGKRLQSLDISDLLTAFEKEFRVF